MPKEHDVFISFAEPDRELAKLLHELFKAVGISSYFAPEALRKTPHDWEEGILKKGLKQTSCFVPIFSKYSVDRKWVIFEAGAATALGSKIFATRVEGITTKEIDGFPRAHRLQHFSLSDREDIKALIENIVSTKHKDEKDILLSQLSKVDEIFDSKSGNERSRLVNELVCQAKKRWVFMAGNIPLSNPPQSEEFRDEFKNFVKSLTMCLFKGGFNLSACPQVEMLGRVVLDSAEEFISEDGFCGVEGCDVDYEIAGIYPVDAQLRISPIPNKQLETQWKKHLLKFRRSYLENKDWLIIIGGNAGTNEEFEALKEINKTRRHGIKVCLIPHFGGAGRRLMEDSVVQKHPDLYFNGCKGWDAKAGIEKLAENVAKMIKEN